MRALLAALVLLVANSVAASDDLDSAETIGDALLLRIAQATGDARSDFLVAQLLDKRADAVEDSLLKRELSAVAKRLRDNLPESNFDAVLAALQVADRTEATKNPVSYRQRLQTLEAAVADNAFYAITLLELPEFANSDAASQLLGRAALSLKYQSMTVPILRSLYPRYLSAVRAGAEPEGELVSIAGPEAYAFESAMSHTFAVALPSYSRLVNLCKKPEQGLRANCQRMALLMAKDADNLIDLLIALAIQKNSTSDPEALAQIDEQTRQARWLSKKIASLYDELDVRADGKEWSPAQRALLAQYMQTWLSEGELAAILEMLQGAEIPLQAPADWQPAARSTQSEDAADAH